MFSFSVFFLLFFSLSCVACFEALYQLATKTYQRLSDKLKEKSKQHFARQQTCRKHSLESRTLSETSDIM